MSALALAGLLSAAPALVGAAPHYLRSQVGAPWGVSENEQQMDRVFGPGAWVDARYETVDVAALFAQPDFIFMEGSDETSDELEDFLAAHEQAIADFVNGGGVIFINAAPNEGDGMSFGFGVSLVGPGLFCAVDCNAVDPAHPIFAGPFTPVGTSFSGNQFSHAAVTGPATPLITNTESGDVLLAELRVGRGTALFGGMSTPNFHLPEDEARNLRGNIIAYGLARLRGDATLALAPATAENPASTTHTVVAHAENALGAIAGAAVLFEVSGANPTTGAGTTDAAGDASFSYTGAKVGADTIDACLDENADGVCGEGEALATASAVWTEPEPPGALACRIAYQGFITTVGGHGATFSGSARLRGGKARSANLYRDLGRRGGFGLTSVSTQRVSCSGRSATLEGQARTTLGELVSYRIDLRDRFGLFNDGYRIRLSNGYDSGLQRLLDGNVEVRSR
jgi:hypothetical protein